MAIDYTHIFSSEQLTIDADLDLQSNKAINVANPTNAQDAATKDYVDTQISAIVYLSASNFVFNEVLTVSTGSATLAFTPIVGTVQVYKNGLLLTPGVGKDYTILGGTITFLVGTQPVNRFLASYIK